MSSKIRLIKIASEINVSKDTIVEFLLSRGFDIDNKPTATLDKNMQDVVYEKFHKEKQKAETQREKLLQQKEISIVAKAEGKQESTDEIAKEDAKPVGAVEPVAVEKTNEKSITEEIVDKVDEVLEKTTASKDKELEDDKQKETAETKEIIDLNKFDDKKETATQTTETKQKQVVKKVSDKKKTTRPKERTPKKGKLTQNLGDLLKKTDIVVAKETDITELPTRIQAKIEAEKQSQKGKTTEKLPLSTTEAKPTPLSEEKLKEEKEDVKGKTLAKTETKPAPPSEEKEDVIEETLHETKDEEDFKPGDKMELKGLTVLGKIELKTEVPTERNARDRQDKRSRRDRAKERNAKDRDRRAKKDYNTTKERNAKDKKNIKDTKDGKDNKDYRDRRHRNKEEGVKSQDKKFISRGENRQRPKAESDTSNFRSKQKGANAPVQRVFTDEPAQPAKLKNAMYAEKKKKRSIRETLSEEDVNRKIRETLSGMDDHSLNIRRSRIKQKKKADREEKEAKLQQLSEIESHTLSLTEFVTTNDLSKLINVPVNEIILKCMELGLMVTINQRLDKDTILLIASDYGLEVEFEEEDKIPEIELIEDKPSDLLPRPPIVTIMGHVDHGKTSLLDHIRNANVVAGEAGGITQHIGAYRVVLKSGKSITFLDTPGHEAFTAMRARGAQVTDIVVLVVAADDSVMPQTIEAISHARAANVPIVVAINKIDKPDANPDRIKQQLSEQGVLIEEWGGKFQSAEISAKKGINIDVLLDKILLEAEMLDLKANPNRNANGIVIESKMTKGWGNVATVVVQNGTLEIGHSFVAGASYGKTRALLDERGNKVEDVLPSQPVVVIGFDGLPEAGDSFNVVSSDTQAREIATSRRQLRREQEMRKVRHITLDDISAQISIGGVKDLFLVIKGDVAGSVEALSDSLQELSTEEVRVNILHKSAGNITESDVMLAAASNAVIIGFNTDTMSQAMRLADMENVEIRNYNIIYDCINEVQLALEGMLKPEIKEEILATVEVRQIFKVGRSVQIAGCYVLSGKVSRNDKVRILRNGLPIHTAVVSSLRRGKDDVREVEQNYECGIQIEGWNNYEENDIIEAYKLVEVKRNL